MTARSRRTVAPGPLGAVRWALALAASVVALGFSAAYAAPAVAGEPSLGVYSEVIPTNLAPGAEGVVIVAVSNLGDAPVEAATSHLMITDSLPPGLTATAISGQAKSGSEVNCPTGKPPTPPLTCSFSGILYPYERLEVTIKVKVGEPPGTSTSLPDQVQLEGGGAPPKTSTLPIAISEQAAQFGVHSYELAPSNEDGTPDVLAGSHPFELTTTLVMNQTSAREPVAQPKDLRFNLPAGFVGNPNAVTQCTLTAFDAVLPVSEVNLCPASSVLGVATVAAFEPAFASGVVTKTVPVFNLVPQQGEPARFGLDVIGKIPIVIDTSVRTGRGYGVVAEVRNATQVAGLLSSQVTLWGVPGAPSHNSSRGWECVAGGAFANQIHRSCPATTELEQKPFLTLPTSCAASPASEPVASLMEADSWAEPGRFLGSEYEWLSGSGVPLGFEGCSELPFGPALGVSPEAHSASTPAGLAVDVKVPQATTLEAGGRAEADVRDTTLTLPEGVQLNPSAATGLEACSEAQVGFEAINPQTGMQEFSGGGASCPEGSKVGAVHIKTPLLSHELEGSVYLAQPAPNGEAGMNPFGSLVALYLVAEDPASGVLVKLAGEGSVNEGTGQLSTTFRDSPQVPFEDLNVELFGGERASLSTPAVCGSYASRALFTPWSSTSWLEVLSRSSEFEVVSGVGGGPCPGKPLAFAPEFSAQSTSTGAGAFTHFLVEIARPDGQQQLSGLTMHLPAGIAALLATVTPCLEPPVGVEWSCGPASLIGHSSAASGLGSYPVTLPGNVYLTTGYDGAPFGLLVQTRAKAGPFDLGNVNVRSRINVDPNTAAVSITTDPGPRGEGFPTMIRGIPAQIKKILVGVDREGFEFNPTNCDPMSISGTVDGAEGANVAVSSPFQVSGCQSLPFHPTLTAATSGHASKADGTGFTVKVTSAGLGQANIAKVDLELPKQLPSRLPTIQKACLASVFEANPAACDEGSLIGTATIHTPVLKNPLSGPAYLVSHGNAAFPDVEFVLQGEGIKLVLDGKTQIKNGVTYSKFESAPDAPFTIFETVLPAGPHSALTANVAEHKHFELCGETLQMPTTITAQNGTIIEHNTKIAIDGCAAVKATKAKRLTNAQKLTKALAACRKHYKHAKTKRLRCEKLARRRYPLAKRVRRRGHAVARAHGR